MARTYFSRGCRGNIVVRLQQGLLAERCAPQALVQFADGDYGGKTATAVRNLQQRDGLDVTGEVDQLTWERATRSPLPSLFERVLQLTADFEGHGFGLAQGNFDGAGVTWGIIGFTLQGGELQRVMHEVDRSDPQAVDAAFGALAPAWRNVLAETSWSRQLAWADSISLGTSKARLQPAWVQAFARLGALPVTQQVQIEIAHQRYYEPALRSAGRLDLETERGVALCFDTHVQSGGVRDSVFHASERFPPGTPEAAMLLPLADEIAEAVARPEWREDVRSRRRCIARGSGTVHGAAYQLDAWGIGLFPA
jgi:peptidoglycan hydrolase-like protein with peptidoglycan-binding domain